MILIRLLWRRLIQNIIFKGAIPTLFKSMTLELLGDDFLLDLFSVLSISGNNISFEIPSPEDGMICDASSRPVEW